MRRQSERVHSESPGDIQKTKEQLRNALRLLQLEADARLAESTQELLYHLANETADVLGWRQMFVLHRKGRKMRVRASSSVARIDPHAPIICWLEDTVATLENTEGIATSAAFSLPAYAPKNAQETSEYPFRHLMWVPLVTSRNIVYGGMLLARDTPWKPAHTSLAERVSATYVHAQSRLEGKRLARPSFRRNRALLWGAVTAMTVAMFIPVPLTVLAPATVVGRNAPAVTAPLDAIVSEIAIEPGDVVEQGDLLVTFEDTELRNALLIAEEDFAVAQAELARNLQASFVDPSASADVAVSQARLDLARAQRDLAYDRFEKVRLLAPIGGRVVIDNPTEWIGQPVVVGERIMSIADQEDLVIEMQLSVNDAIPLETGAKVRAFMDTNPLSPIGATLTQQGFAPALSEDGTLSFPLRADLTDHDTSLPRIGARGIAQIFGADHPLWYVLFRRPIVAIRQSLGI